MPLSPYLKIYPDPAHPGSFLLYSTKKGSVVRLSAPLLAAAQNDTLSDRDRATLTRLELVVDDPAAERAAMAGLVEQTNRRSKRFKATVVLTLDCNLACPYCFEDHFRGRHAMSPETAGLLVDFVTREQIARGREVEIRFYGGEPLLAVERLKAIAGPLRAAAANGTQFTCSLVTNATLLTRPLVEELVPLGLKGAQLTLDGPPEIHDRQRPFVSGRGSFSAIVANLLAVWDLITLKPGGNFSRENYREFPRLLDSLLAAGVTPAMVGPVQFAPILPKSGRQAGHDNGAGCLASSEPWLAEAGLFLREETLRRGFSVDKPTMGACMVEFANDLVVNYDGSLYKCPGFLGWPELAVGTLAAGVGDYRLSHGLDIWQRDECLDCPYLPLCFGGCRLLTLMKNGAIDAVECRRAFFDASLEQMVRQDLHYPPQRLPNPPP